MLILTHRTRPVKTRGTQDQYLRLHIDQVDQVEARSRRRLKIPTALEKSMWMQHERLFCTITRCGHWRCCSKSSWIIRRGLDPWKGCEITHYFLSDLDVHMALVRPALLHQRLDQYVGGQPLVEVVCWNSVIMSSSTGVVGDATPSFSNHLHFKMCMAHVESSILSLNLKCTLCFPPYSFRFGALFFLFHLQSN